MDVRNPVDADEARAELIRLVGSRPGSLAALSRMIGRNAAYLQQYVRRGTPRFLEPTDRRLLADYFGVDEAALGGPPSDVSNRPVDLRVLDVRPSAGSGALVDDERVVTSYRFDPRWLRHLGIADPARVAMMRVRGDSMLPTLADGDEILVAEHDAATVPDGIYVLERDGELIVKRLTRHPGSGLLTISSDNPTYPSWHDCRPDAVRVIGRVAWTLHRTG